jgi:hypothetical protein
MTTFIPPARRLLIAGAVVGALAMAGLGGAGQAGAAPSTRSPEAAAHAGCLKGLTHAQRVVARYNGLSNRLARLHASEAQATAAGQARRAAHLAKLINHETAVRTRMSHSKALARATKKVTSTSACAAVPAATTSSVSA